MQWLTHAILLLASTTTCYTREVATEEFLSRRDIIPPALDVVHIDSSAVSEDYIFLSPEMHSHTNFTRAMYIYNHYGVCLASVANIAKSKPHMLTTIRECCTYANTAHICATFFNGQQSGGTAIVSYSLIIDSSYRQVQALEPSFEYFGSTLTQGLHEFHLVDDGSSALMSSMATVEQSATFHDCPGAPAVSFLETSLFTEVSTDGTNTTLFHWNALDHLNVTESVICPGYLLVGQGDASDDGVDFFHINAVDKNADGDYLVSGRHTNAIYKVAGNDSPSEQPPGSIIWRLGGKASDFTFQNESSGSKSGAFRFSFQHHSRFYKGGIRVFDNANSEITELSSTPLIASATTSSGMDIELDEAARTAALVYQAIAPSGLLSSSQGSHQKLTNGNHFCGMGSVNEIFERTESGAPVFDAFIGGKGVSCYRASKGPWTGNPPVNELNLFTYAHNSSSPNAYYVSWNGATDVASYHFFVANSSDGQYTQTAAASKDSAFETLVIGASFGLSSYAEALDRAGNILGRTPTVHTFVPDKSLARSCSHLKCAPYTDYTSARRASEIEVKYVNTYPREIT